jgi:hypothetical protein
MTNIHTTLPIEYLFENPKDFTLNTKSNTLMISSHNHNINDVKIEYTCDEDGRSHLYIGDSDKNFVGKKIDFSSHMKTFEIIHPYTKNPIEIRRGQGIGVIVDFSRDTYIKLYYGKTSKNNHNIEVIFSCWTYSDKSGDKYKPYKVLSEDLGLGYDVYIIDYLGNEHRLCEMDNRDYNRDKLGL